MAAEAKIGSLFVGNAKSLSDDRRSSSCAACATRCRYSQGDRMMLSSGGGWMVEGSLPRLLRDYNQLIEAYNRGTRI